MRKCGLQKLAIIAFIFLIEVIGYYFKVPLIVEMVYTYYVIMEAMSVCENLNAIGVKIPTKLLKFFEENKED